DPFVPAPTPIGRMDDEADAINKLISSRYSNPVNIRAIRAMSASQATNLFAEVSQRIDERHLQPTSYDVRVRRALRNLVMALDNPAFTQSLGISSDSFRLDGFRNTLSSMAGSMRVSNQSDARNVMNTVMQQAQTVPGLSPNVIAFEFANASIDTLDKFSGIEPKDPAVPGAAVEKETRNASLEDQIVGVGVEVKEDQRGLLVVKSLRGGPAEEAGIQSGDVIVSIDGRSIEGVPMVNSVDLMKGSAGSSMVVRIYRSGKGEKNFSLVRRSIRVWTVNDTRILDGTQIGYLSLSRFAQNSTAELDQALSELHSQGMNSLIIDLRGNPGGLLTTCVEISDRFLPCGTIVSTKGRLSTDNMLEQATWSRTWNTPLVVLVDGDSASASEIFAAAVQENQRGVVVGTNSYGKGTVQTHFPLNSISGNLRLTTAKFYSPNGREMAGQGVKPDVRVEDADGVANGDKVLMQAVRIAQSTQVQEMAKAAGTCRTGQPSAARSSSLENFNDPAHIVTAVR
ncbi:MAG: S41 family peptidase, partial [Planctomycetaceae bacterium]|nr:S41 family peptidase [Planctomycetaceae bacterium]